VSVIAGRAAHPAQAMLFFLHLEGGRTPTGRPHTSSRANPTAGGRTDERRLTPLGHALPHVLPHQALPLTQPHTRICPHAPQRLAGATASLPSTPTAASNLGGLSSALLAAHLQQQQQQQRLLPHTPQHRNSASLLPLLTPPQLAPPASLVPSGPAATAAAATTAATTAPTLAPLGAGQYGFGVHSSSSNHRPPGPQPPPATETNTEGDALQQLLSNPGERPAAAPPATALTAGSAGHTCICPPLHSKQPPSCGQH
jgi:hypothetical protein